MVYFNSTWEEVYFIECNGGSVLSLQILNQIKKVNMQLRYVSHHAKASIFKCAINYNCTN